MEKIYSSVDLLIRSISMFEDFYPTYEFRADFNNVFFSIESRSRNQPNSEWQILYKDSLPDRSMEVSAQIIIIRLLSLSCQILLTANRRGEN